MLASFTQIIGICIYKLWLYFDTVIWKIFVYRNYHAKIFFKWFEPTTFLDLQERITSKNFVQENFMVWANLENIILTMKISQITILCYITTYSVKTKNIILTSPLLFVFFPRIL